MNVLQYLNVRAQKISGAEVSEDDWNDVIKFEEEHPELRMEPSAVSISEKEGE